MMQNYDYDVIMLRTTLRELENPADRTYSVRILTDFVDLPSDRLNVEAFPSNPLGQLLASPCDLIGALSCKGIGLVVNDLGRSTGSGKAVLGPLLLGSLNDKSCDVSQYVTVELIKNKRPVGTVDLKVKFKSTDDNVDTRFYNVGCYDVCRPLEKGNPGDMLFTLGRSERCAASTCITDERLMSQVGAPFSCVHTAPSSQPQQCSCVLRGVNTPGAIDQAAERERRLLRRLLTDMGIDDEKVPKPPETHALSRRCQCKKPQQKPTQKPTSETLGSWTSSDCRQSAGLMPHQLKALEEVRKCPDVAVPDLTTAKYKPALLCPVCQANITWLPKLAACPYCGYKRIDLDKPSEEPFDETATAAEVLRNHFLTANFLQTDDANPKSERSEKSQRPKDCSCKTERVCTKCRVKELSDQMLEGARKNRHSIPSAKPSTKSVKAKSESPSEHRKQLISIFTEMRDAYGDKGETAAEICNKVAASKKKGRGRGRTSRGKARSSRAKKQILKELEEAFPSRKKKPKVKRTEKTLRSKRYTFLEPQEQLKKQKMAHLCCARDSGRVPCHMGWMWTRSELARHRCWKPGAIMKPIRQIMAYFLKDYPADVINPSRFHCKRNRRGKQNEVSVDDQVEEEPLIQHPMLHITKHRDDYVITLRPLKDPDVLSKAANPFANMKPMVFRITKDPVAAGMRDIKQKLKEQGLEPCTCKQPVASCFCRTHVEQKIVEHAVRTLAAERGWRDITSCFVYDEASETESENELDFGVTPPAGVIKPERLVHADRVNTDTQYDDNDWAMPTMYPHPPSPQVQYGACVSGERKGRFPWILGKGFVHAEPKPPKMINKPKKKSKSKGRQKGGYDGGMKPRRAWHKSN
ncbi:hypothetical protein KR222_007851, partial [Zaprionus bogoriensis]